MTNLRFDVDVVVDLILDPLGLERLNGNLHGSQLGYRLVRHHEHLARPNVGKVHAQLARAAGTKPDAGGYAYVIRLPSAEKGWLVGGIRTSHLECILLLMDGARHGGG